MLRPLWLIIGLMAVFTVVKHFIVPSNFGVQGRFQLKEIVTIKNKERRD
jgi:hypothetical protein